MSCDDSPNRLAEAAEEFNRRTARADGADVVRRLAGGFDLLCASLYLRAHRDVEEVVGMDSMLAPVSESKTKRRATAVIEALQIAESTAAVGDFGYLGPAALWYLPWLTRLRIGEPAEYADLLDQARGLLGEPPDGRRLAFADRLGRVLPQSTQAPLVLFRLVPLAIRIATASAFGDPETASELRREQGAILPAISDCRQCGGRILDCGRECATCGNPLWNYEWLTAVG